MKKLASVLLALSCLCSPAFGQGQVPADLVSVDTNNFSNIVPGEGWVFTPETQPSSNRLKSVQWSLQWLDDNAIGTSDIAGIYIDIGALNTNFAIINSNFTLISNDFVSVSNYLLAGSTGLVRVLQANQDLTVTNFMRVNTNTFLTSNLFYRVGEFLGLTNDEPALGTNDPYWATYEAQTQFYGIVDSFLLMNTNYANLPTNLDLSFPSLFERVDDDIGEVAGGGIVSLSNLVVSMINSPLTYAIPIVGGLAVVSHTNGRNQSLDLIGQTNVSVRFDLPIPAHGGDITLWARASSNCAVAWDISDDVARDASADELNEVSVIAMLKYNINPWSGKWTERQLYPAVNPTNFVAPDEDSAAYITNAVGGTVSTQNIDGIDYILHTYTLAGVSTNFVVNGFDDTNETAQIDCLIIAGGGGGGRAGAGGGAGGYRILYGKSVVTGSYPVKVGLGGTGDTTVEGTGGSGGNSWAYGTNSEYVAYGGGGGATWNFNITPVNGSGGGCGGGGVYLKSGVFGNGGAGSQGQNGGRGSWRSSGGGGGSLGPGGVASYGGPSGRGGAGFSTTFEGSSAMYCGGGGGGAANNGVAGSGGAGGGGAGSTVGTANTGGGGGGGSITASPFSGANGGSGKVVIRYRKAP